MAQRIVEMVIGRLIADEDFRASFSSDPHATLLALCDLGFELSRTEIAALVNTNRSIWQTAAEGLDPRLQKASLENRRS